MNARQISEIHTDEDSRRMFAGLALLARQYAAMLTHSRREDDQAFFEIFDKLNGNTPEARYSDVVLTEYRGQQCEQLLLEHSLLPVAGASALSSSPALIACIPSGQLIHEWTVLPGSEFFVRFRKQWKSTICGKGGPYEKFHDNLVGQSELPATIAATLLVSGFKSAAFWYPLALYLSLLLIKTGLATFCESPASEEG